MKNLSLPLTHVTPWENFQKIAFDGLLKPQKCPFFKENLVYLNYGRLAHKPSQKDYNWNENSPVVIFFNSTVLGMCKKVFPFDTGAIISGRFRKSKLNSKHLKDRFCLNSHNAVNPHEWINTIYGNSSDYIENKFPKNLTDDSYMNSLLLEAYSQQYNNEELDYRLTSVECQSENPILLNNSFLLILPYEKRDEFQKLNLSQKYNVCFYKDKSLNGYLPKDLASLSTRVIKGN